MSHQIHHTEGIILSSTNFGEANKYISIFTKDFGMIYALAQGVRKLESKLRYSLQDFSYSKIDLVRGREVWRITSASPVTSLSYNVIRNEEIFKILSNTSKLLKRLCQGEEQNIPLFSHLSDTLSFLNNNDFNTEKLRDFELIVVIRMLYYLGYIGEGKRTQEFIDSSPFESLMDTAKKDRTSILTEINNAIKESQL